MNGQQKKWLDSLKKAIDESGNTRYYHAKNLGMGYNTLSNYYHGKNFPTVKNYLSIRKYFKL